MVDLQTYLRAARQSLAAALRLDLPYYPLSFRARNASANEVVDELPDFTLRDLTAAGNRCAIVGAPGAGKTRALRDLAASLCQEAFDSYPHVGTVPVLVPLRRCRLPSPHDDCRWEDVLLGPLNHTLSRHGCEFGSGKELIDLLAQHDFALLLDGLNEVASTHSTWLLDLVDESDLNCSVVVSSRVREWPTQRADYKIFQINSLAYPDQMLGFLSQVASHEGLSPAVERDIEDACENDVVLRGLASNPYLFSRFICAAKRGLPRRPWDRVSLLELVLNQAIEDSKCERSAADLLLKRLGHFMHFDEQALSVSEARFTAHCGATDLTEQAATHTIAALADSRILLRQAPVTPGIGHTLEFAHQVFQEFYAGKSLADQLEHAATAGQAFRKLKPYARRLWNWEGISVAVGCLLRVDALKGLKLAGWLVAKQPYLAAQVLAELPRVDGHGQDYREALTAALRRLLRRLERRGRFWSFGVPHAYKWLPAASVAALLAMGHQFARRTWPQLADVEVTLGGPSPTLAPALAAVVGFGILLAALYFRLLRRVYSHLDEAIFDSTMQRVLGALELLRFRGGAHGLAELRAAAASNPYMGDRMRAWIQSTTDVSIGDIEDIAPIVLSSTRLAEIAADSEDHATEAVDALLALVRRGTERVRDRLKALDCLAAVVARRTRDDVVSAYVRDELRKLMGRELPKALRERVAAVVSGSIAPRRRARSRRPIALRLAAATLGVVGFALVYRFVDSRAVVALVSFGTLVSVIPIVMSLARLGTEK